MHSSKRKCASLARNGYYHRSAFVFGNTNLHIIQNTDTVFETCIKITKDKCVHIYILQNTDLHFKTQIRFTTGVTVDTKILHLCFEKQIRIWRKNCICVSIGWFVFCDTYFVFLLLLFWGSCGLWIVSFAFTQNTHSCFETQSMQTQSRKTQISYVSKNQIQLLKHKLRFCFK